MFQNPVPELYPAYMIASACVVVLVASAFAGLYIYEGITHRRLRRIDRDLARRRLKMIIAEDARRSGDANGWH